MGLLLALALTLTTPAAHPGDLDPAAGYWNQDRGDGAATGGVEVAPMLTLPEELWRLERTVVSDPVVWGPRVFVVVDQRGKQELVALDVETGEELASAKLGRLEDGAWRLACWQDKVIVLDREQVRAYRSTDSKLRKAWTLKVPTRSEAAVDDGLLVVQGEEGMLLIDAEKGDRIGGLDHGHGRPLIVDQRVVTLDLDPRDGRTLVLVSTAPMFGDMRKRKDWSPFATTLRLRETTASPEEARTSLVAFPPELPGTYETLTYVLVLPDGSTLTSSEPGDGYASKLTGGAVAHDGKLLGFSADGITRQLRDGRSGTLLETGSFPDGLVPGPISRASHVAYAGNMALDLGRQRVLWVREDHDAAGPLIPVEGARGLYRSRGDELVMLGNPGAVAAVEEAQPRAERPDSGAGWVDPDGRFHVGVPEPGQAAVELPGAGGARVLTDLWPAYLAWRGVLDQELADELVERLESYRKARLADECQRVLVELEALDLPAPRLEELRAAVAKVRPTTSASVGLKRDRIGREELESKLASVAARQAAAVWCRDRGLDDVATLLHQDAGTTLAEARSFVAAFRFESARPPEVPGQLELPEGFDPAALVPDRFPYTGAGVPALWPRWLRELLPAGGRFLTPADPGFPRTMPAPWDRDTLVLATRNVVLLTRCQDPAIVGSVLRNGEGAARLLDELFQPEGVDAAPMQVRLHANRADYLADPALAGGSMEWSLGVYNSAERVSRFHVPEEADARTEAKRDEQLMSVLVHELTHQYIAERAGLRLARRADLAGHWVVEGFARFVEHQAVELGRRGRGLDDATVASVDCAARAAEQDALIPLPRLLATTARTFLELGDELILTIRPHYSLGTYQLSERSLYYQQGGSLAFYLMNRRGPEGRALLLDYLRAHYEGRLDGEAWTLLGFDSLEEFEAAFRAFLAAPLAD